MVCKECIAYGWLTFLSMMGGVVAFYLYGYYHFSRNIFLTHSNDLKRAEQREINQAVRAAYKTLSNPEADYMRRKKAFKL
jgi:hypothetical protein